MLRYVIESDLFFLYSSLSDVRFSVCALCRVLRHNAVSAWMLSHHNELLLCVICFCVPSFSHLAHYTCSMQFCYEQQQK